jgi:hypothetical protein
VIARSTIPILRCSAGGLPMGFCAEEVAEFQAPAASSPHLAWLLGLDEQATVMTGGLTAEGKRERKTLRLHAGGRAALVMVDGPLSLRALDQSDLLPVPRLLGRGRVAPIIGFTEEEGRVVLLLDVSGVIGMVEGARGTETRTGS